MIVSSLSFFLLIPGVLQLIIMHQSFVSTTPEVFKAWLRGQICGKVPAKSPGSPENDNNVEQQLVVVLMKNYERWVLNSACKCTGTFVCLFVCLFV